MTAKAIKPDTALPLVVKPVAPLCVPPDFDVPVALPVALDAAAAVGTKVALGFEIQELAAALAAEADGADGLTVPLPAKLQD